MKKAEAPEPCFYVEKLWKLLPAQKGDAENLKPGEKPLTNGWCIKHQYCFEIMRLAEIAGYPSVTYAFFEILCPSYDAWFWRARRLSPPSEIRKDGTMNTFHQCMGALKLAYDIIGIPWDEPKEYLLASQRNGSG